MGHCNNFTIFIDIFKNLDNKYAAIADAMIESYKSIEVEEEDMDFNEDEDYVFNHLFEAREHLYAIL